MGELGLMMTLGVLVLGMALGCGTARAAEPGGPLKEAAWGPFREWAPGGADGSVHGMGNGRLCVYGQGPDVIQIVGPPYSATTIGRISLEQPGLTARSRRALGTAIWEHRIEMDGRVVAVLTDFVDCEQPCFVRRIETTVPLEFVFHAEPGLVMADNSSTMQKAGANGGFLVETPIGRPSVPFGNYPIPFAFFHQFAWVGEVTPESSESGGTVRFRFLPGQSTLLAAGGPGLPECLDHMKTVLSEDFSTLLARTQAWWAAFTAEGTDFASTLPADVPMRERLVQVLDDVAVLIKAQQAAEGGILAGYPYHLGYVRDQYGTHRGLVALGHEEMSRDILRFYFDTFQAGGRIHNAQAFGIPGLYHVHENDEVEITGYITLQAFDYLARSEDVDFTRTIFPMLEWAWMVQQKHFVNDMLPFNGDETYVAGSILPRSALNDGSAEATMLFIESGRLLLEFAAREGLWAEERVETERRIWKRVHDSFRANFWRDGQLITNNPGRSSDPAKLPTVRHGVCEACVTVRWTLRTENGRYECLDCLGEAPLPSVEPTVYTLQSVSLTPLYFHAVLLDKEDLRPQVEQIVQSYQKTGKLPSRPDSDVAVGYDYGLLLYALTELGHPMARDLYEKTLTLADSTGAWAEYYRDHQPAGTRCRPWESAINVESLLHWIEKAHSG